MEKINELINNNKYVKYYSCGENIVPVELLTKLKTAGFQFDKIFLKEDAEMDMQMRIGQYSLEELENNKNLFLNNDIYNFTVYAIIDENQVEIHFYNDSKVLYMITDNKYLELDDLLQKKTKLNL